MTTSDPDLLDEIDAHARRSDPQTSHDAAASVKVRESQKTVLRLLKATGPCTDDELLEFATREHVSITPSGLRTRRSELVRAALVVDTGDRKRKQTGRMAIVWAVAS